MKLWFENKGASAEPRAFLDDELLRFPGQFGRAEFRFDQDIDELKWVLSIADCFISMVDPVGLSDFIHWSPFPGIRDPKHFKPGGIHTLSAVAYWESEIPNLSA